MERVWYHALYNSIRVDPAHHRVMVIEPPLNPLKDRERMAQIFFERFNVPALYIAGMASLALYGLGQSTGVVVELGHGVCHVVPVYQGYSITNAIIRIDFGGRNVTDQLHKLLTAAGVNLTTTAEHEIAEHIKYQLAYVSLDPISEAHNFNPSMIADYEMPDGQKIRLGKERFQCAEVLFQPSLMGKEIPGIHELVYQSVERCDLNIRRTLYSTIIVGGGSSMLPGLDKRLQQEIQRKLPADVQVNVIASPNRAINTWCGGAALAASDAFQSLWITKEQWKSMGPSCLHGKCYQ